MAIQMALPAAITFTFLRLCLAWPRSSQPRGFQVPPWPVMSRRLSWPQWTPTATSTRVIPARSISPVATCEQSCPQITRSRPPTPALKTFNVSLHSVGTRSITVTDTATAITGKQSSIMVVPAAAAYFVIDAPSTVDANAPFDITVTAKDPYSNVATGYRGMVHLTSSDSTAILPANYQYTAGDAGTHSFFRDAEGRRKPKRNRHGRGQCHDCGNAIGN